MSEIIFISVLGFLPMINNKSRGNVQGPYLPERTPKKRKKASKASTHCREIANFLDGAQVVGSNVNKSEMGKRSVSAHRR